MDSVLEHVREYKDWVAELARITRKKGYVFIIVPSIWGAFSLMNDVDWKQFRWKSQPYNHHPLLHCNHFKFTDLKEEFVKQGFEVKNVFKFQAFNPLVKYILKKVKLYSLLYQPYTWIDYHIAKLLPKDVATRVIIFERV